jgi:hypothetical protein
MLKRYGDNARPRAPRASTNSGPRATSTAPQSGARSWTPSPSSPRHSGLVRAHLGIDIGRRQLVELALFGTAPGPLQPIGSAPAVRIEPGATDVEDGGSNPVISRGGSSRSSAPRSGAKRRRMASARFVSLALRSCSLPRPASPSVKSAATIRARDFRRATARLSCSSMTILSPGSAPWRISSPRDLGHSCLDDLGGPH